MTEFSEISERPLAHHIVQQSGGLVELSSHGHSSWEKNVQTPQKTTARFFSNGPHARLIPKIMNLLTRSSVHRVCNKQRIAADFWRRVAQADSSSSHQTGKLLIWVFKYSSEAELALPLGRLWQLPQAAAPQTPCHWRRSGAGPNGMGILLSSQIPIHPAERPLGGKY